MIIFMVAGRRDPTIAGMPVFCVEHFYLNSRKVKFALEQAMKARKGSRDIPLLFL
jgi:hypothetical protein